MIGNLKKGKKGTLSRVVDVKGKQIVLSATRGECRGTSHWIDFSWDDDCLLYTSDQDVEGLIVELLANHTIG